MLVTARPAAASLRSPSVISTDLALSSATIGQGPYSESGKESGKDSRGELTGMDTGFKKGDRVFHPRWNTAATVITVFGGGAIGIKCDDAPAVEVEVDITDVDQIPGQGDASVPTMVMDTTNWKMFITE